MINQVHEFARSSSTVLISGETGTGKEMLARYCHDMSPRSAGPFVPVNCAALPEDLLESELFGHRKGSFTGAIENHEGLMVKANGGTLFLDEVADMSLKIQAKLLRVVQERRVRPVGESSEVPVDIRIVCASHRNLLQAVNDKEFRQDLYFRLSVLPVHVPPLRVRPEDTLALSRHFLSTYCSQAHIAPKRITTLTEKKLTGHSWPGNVRELSNVIERVLVYSTDHLVYPEDIHFDGDQITNYLPDSENLFYDLDLKILERKAISFALRASNGIKIQAARRLGIDRKTLLRKEKEYGLESAETQSLQSLDDNRRQYVSDQS